MAIESWWRRTDVCATGWDAEGCLTTVRAVLNLGRLGAGAALGAELLLVLGHAAAGSAVPVFLAGVAKTLLTRDTSRQQLLARTVFGLHLDLLVAVTFSTVGGALEPL